jgi:hypothetical protein
VGFRAPIGERTYDRQPMREQIAEKAIVAGEK